MNAANETYDVGSDSDVQWAMSALETLDESFYLTRIWDERTFTVSPDDLIIVIEHGYRDLTDWKRAWTMPFGEFQAAVAGILPLRLPAIEKVARSFAEEE